MNTIYLVNVDSELLNYIRANDDSVMKVFLGLTKTELMAKRYSFLKRLLYYFVSLLK